MFEERSEVFINLSLVFISIVIVLAGFEAALRLGMLSYTGYKWCNGPGTNNVFHPEYGWTRAPDSQYLWKITPADDWSTYTYNSQGFRDTYNSGQGENIIVLGDSFTEGWLVDDEATYPYLLDRWIPNKPVRNYGMSGYGTAQELLVYQNISDRYDHDVVVLGYYPGNDMDNNVNMRANRPRYGLKNDSLVQVHEPSPKRGGITDNPAVNSVQNTLRKYTWSYTYIEPKIQRILVKLKGTQTNRTPPTGDELTGQLRLTREILLRLTEEVEANDAELVILIIPDRSRIVPAKAADSTLQEQRIQYWNTQRRMLRRLSENHTSVDIVNLGPDLKEGTENGKQVYGAQNKHLDDPGHRITAKVTYEWLAENGYLRDRSEPNFSKNYGRETTVCPG